MDPRASSTDLALVGRASERAAIGTLIDRATGGEAGAMLISGDAGVGKTALVERACSNADSSVVVLAGACLPLSAMTVPRAQDAFTDFDALPITRWPSAPALRGSEHSHCATT